MDLEQLKVIMETIGVATGTAKTFGIFWLIIQLLKFIFGYSLGGGIALGAYKIISRVVRSFVEEESFGKALRQIVDSERAYGSFTRGERENIINLVKLGMEHRK